MYLIIILIVIIILLLRSYTESFISSIPTLNNSKNLNDTINLNAKVSFVYTKHDGVYKFFRDNYIVTNNINDRPKLIRTLFNNVNSVKSVESGFYNYKYNYLGLLYKNNIYKLNLFTQTLVPPIFVKDYFNGLENAIINCLFYLEQNIYIFTENKVVVYSLTENKIIKNSDCNKIFDKLPSYPPECCFLNYNDMEINNPVPYIYILKNGLYYRYTFNIDTDKFTFVDTTKDLKNNTIINTSQKHKISLDGIYRITCIGGGIESGGKGGLIFNDIKFKKNDILKIIVGKKGNRLPVKNNLLNETKKNNLPNLPNTGSCSGAGATSLYKGDDLLMIAGGGGGWSSEIINGPTICNSVAYLENNKNNHKPNLFLPIKKIMIFSSNDKEKRYKIKVNKFDVKVVGLEELILDINEYPKINNKKSSVATYETHLSNFNEKANIEIIFNEPICDYKIDLDFEVISSDFDSQSNNKRFKDHINSKVVFYDEQNRSYTISNFNDNFTSDIISSETLLHYFSNNLPNIEYNNDLVKNGASKNKYNEDSNFVNKSNKLFYLDNAYKICGGGFATSNKFNTLNTCGGGGGYKGGKSISLSEDYNYKNISFPIDYVAACGGTSYISNLSSSKNKDKFINDYNVDDGLVIITKLNKSI